MDLTEIKSKFKHKAKADIKDLDLILRAAPELVREIEKLETELEAANKRIEHLSLQLKKRPPLNKQGKKGDVLWEASVDEDLNRLYFILSGKLDYKGAKSASNSIVTVLPNIREGFDCICDFSNVMPGYNQKAIFHLRKMMYNIKQMGVSRVVRIINPQTPRLGQLFEDRFISGFKLYSANSMEEANEMLENVTKFLKM